MKLSRRELALGAGVAAFLLASGLLQDYLAYRDTEQAVGQIEHEQALRVASNISNHLLQVERQIAWTLQPAGTTGAVGLDQRRSDLLRLLRQEQAVTEVRYLDSRGIELVGAPPPGLLHGRPYRDFSSDPRFLLPRVGRPYHSGIYYRNESEPYMTIAVADYGPDAGVTVAEVSLKFLWDVVVGLGTGPERYGYVVDEAGQLLARSDTFQLLDLVVRADGSQALQRRDYSSLPQVQAALAAPVMPPDPEAHPLQGHDLTGREVLAAYARVDPPGWAVVVEQPLAAARGSLYAGIVQTILLAALGLLLWLLASLGTGRLGGRPLRRDGPAELRDTLSSSR
jgi:hypothetical protein